MGAPPDASAIAAGSKLLLDGWRERARAVTLTWPYGGASVEVAGDVLGGWHVRAPLDCACAQQPQPQQQQQHGCSIQIRVRAPRACLPLLCFLIIYNIYIFFLNACQELAVKGSPQRHRTPCSTLLFKSWCFAQSTLWMMHRAAQPTSL